MKHWIVATQAQKRGTPGLADLVECDPADHKQFQHPIARNMGTSKALEVCRALNAYEPLVQTIRVLKRIIENEHPKGNLEAFRLVREAVDGAINWIDVHEDGRHRYSNSSFQDVAGGIHLRMRPEILPSGDLVVFEVRETVPVPGGPLMLRPEDGIMLAKALLNLAGYDTRSLRMVNYEPPHSTPVTAGVAG